MKNANSTDKAPTQPPIAIVSGAAQFVAPFVRPENVRQLEEFGKVLSELDAHLRCVVITVADQESDKARLAYVAAPTTESFTAFVDARKHATLLENGLFQAHQIHATI